MSQGFPSSEKLKSKIVIDRLFTEGKSLKSYPLRLMYVPLDKDRFTVNKVAVSVPKRNFKKAVDRNYLKRLMREAYRKNKYLTENKFPRPYAMMFVYTGRTPSDLNQISKAIIHILKQLIQKEGTHENSL